MLLSKGSDFMNKKTKTLFILSSIFTILTIIGLLTSIVIGLWYFKELATPAVPCDSTPCISLEGEAFVLIFYIIIGVITLFISIIALIFSIFVRKVNKIGLLSFIINLLTIILVILLFVIMLVTVN